MAQTGFLFLALIWLYSAVRAYTAIRNGQIQLHRIWMVRNYALTTSAIILRLWIGVGAAFFALTHQMPAQLTTSPLYSTAAWICWTIPLVFVEWFMNQRILRSLVHVKGDKSAVAVQDV